MKTSILLFTVLICSTFFGGCTRSNNELPEELLDPHQLKTVLAQSIDIPFPECDTALYHLPTELSNYDKVHGHFAPHLDNEPYAEILQNNYKGKIWFDINELKKLNPQCNVKKSKVFECLTKNKVNVYLYAQMTFINRVEIKERYYFNNEIRTTFKLFEYKNDQWSYRITRNELESIPPRPPKQSQAPESTSPPL